MRCFAFVVPCHRWYACYNTRQCVVCVLCSDAYLPTRKNTLYPSAHVKNYEINSRTGAMGSAGAYRTVPTRPKLSKLGCITLLERVRDRCREGDHYIYFLSLRSYFLRFWTKFSTVPNFLGCPWDGFSAFSGVRCDLRSFSYFLHRNGYVTEVGYI